MPSLVDPELATVKVLRRDGDCYRQALEISMDDPTPLPSQFFLPPAVLRRWSDTA